MFHGFHYVTCVNRSVALGFLLIKVILAFFKRTLTLPLDRNETRVSLSVHFISVTARAFIIIIVILLLNITFGSKPVTEWTHDSAVLLCRPDSR